ncbi:hypothetical protein ASD24_24780 [Paenibacillus sp. Root52]|uniref:hypothetical protein n=1 Tax=Paenibacillus sp. Root52 TaxID=1736552 RepID=UPI000700D04E|nr:hypothetical protein [Paenibacillus sp. Root52]KQY91014.1 hypothetical protein ASD24_24780 [Paenibacillus sp. Root52]
MENKTIEVRSSINDNVVIRFEHVEDSSINIFTAGYQKICKLLKINRVQAEERFYVTEADNK